MLPAEERCKFLAELKIPVLSSEPISLPQKLPCNSSIKYFIPYAIAGLYYYNYRKGNELIGEEKIVLGELDTLINPNNSYKGEFYYAPNFVSSLFQCVFENRETAEEFLLDFNELTIYYNTRKVTNINLNSRFFLSNTFYKIIFSQFIIDNTDFLELFNLCFHSKYALKEKNLEFEYDGILTQNANIEKIISFLTVYYDFLYLPKNLQLKDNLNKYRISFFIYNTIWMSHHAKNLNYITQINKEMEKAEKPWDYFLDSFPKFYKKFDTFIVLLRFINSTLNNNKTKIYAIDISENLRYSNFKRAFINCVVYSEFNPINAVISLLFLKDYINILQFDKYFLLVLEQFLLFTYMVILKYKFTGQIPLYFLSWVANHLLDLYKKDYTWHDSYFFVSFLTPEFLYIFGLDQNNTDFRALIDNVYDTFELNSSRRVKSIVIKMLNNFKHREKYEQFLYLKLIFQYIQKRDNIKKLIGYPNFTKLLQKITSYVIYMNDLLIYYQQPFRNLFYVDYLTIFFEIINHLNLNIKEYFKPIKFEKLKTFSSFLNSLNIKVNKVLENSTIDTNFYQIMNLCIRAYREIKSLNSSNIANICLDEYLTLPYYLPNFDQLTELNELKVFLNYTTGQINNWYKENINNPNTDKAIKIKLILEELNYNRRHNSIEEQTLIRNFIILFLYPKEIICYLIQENIFNYIDKDKSISLLSNLFTVLVDSKQKSCLLTLVTSIKHMEVLFENEKNIICTPYYKKETSYQKERAREIKLLTLNSYLSPINKSGNLHNNLMTDSIKAFKTSQFIWESIINTDNITRLVDELMKFNFNKICLNILEETVNKEMRENNIKKIFNYENTLLLEKYYNCYKRIDGNEYIMNKYTTKELANKLKTNEEKPEISYLKKIFEKIFYTLDFSYLDDIDIFILNKNFDLPINMEFEFKVITALKKLFILIRTTSIEEFEQLKKVINDIVTLIRAIFREGDKLNGCYTFNKAVYELFVISRSIINYKEKTFLQELNDDSRIDIETESLLDSIIKRRKLGIFINNSLLFKIRRALCRLTKNIRLEQKILIEMIQLYKRKDDNLLQKYFTIFEDNFKSNDFDKRDKEKQIYVMLKTCLYFNDSEKFEKYFQIYQSSDTDVNNKHKFQKFYFKNLKIKGYPNKLLYEEIDKYFEGLYGFESNTNYIKINKKEKKGISLFEKKFFNYDATNLPTYQEKLLFSHVMNYRISLKVEEFRKEPEDNHQNNKLTDLLNDMTSVSLWCIEKDLAFKVLPLTFNYLYTTYNSLMQGKVNINVNLLLKMCGLLGNLEKDKIGFILPQLLMVYTQEKSPIYELAINLLGTYVNTYPHQNAFWLCSLLDKHDPDSDNQNNQNNSNLNTNNTNNYTKSTILFRNTFGNKILQKLSDDNKKIIFNYAIFLEMLRTIHKEALKVGNNYNSTIKATIKKINEFLIKNKPEIILPNLKNMKIKTNYAINNFNKNKNNIDTAPATLECFGTQGLSVEYEDDKEDTKQNIIGIENYEGLPQLDFIKEMCQEFHVFNSKDKPIKISFLSNEKRFNFLLKGGIKDIFNEVKAGEVFSAVNYAFNLDELDTNYGIGLRQYNLTPVASNMIIIEWLEKCDILKNIIEEEWFNNGINYSIEYLEPEYKGDIDKNEYYQLVYDKVEAKGNLLYKYYLNKFHDPNEWYESKQRYIISTAVWAMVGLFIGLGDRHLLNIMVSDKGEIINIDFGFIMGTGKRLPVPEIVDFRLTYNIRRALGLLEENGTFVFIAELTLLALAKHFSSLLTKLQFFVFDPQLDNNERYN